MNFNLNFLPGINRAIELLGHWFVIMWGYTWAKVILSTWIEGNPRANTNKGKVIAGLIGLAITVAFAAIIGIIMFKEFDAFVTIICIMSISCVIAIYTLYKEVKKDV